MKAFLTVLSIVGVAVAAHAAMAAPGLSMAKLAPQLLPLPAEACAALVSKTSASDGVPFRRLDQLPQGVVEHAVLRSVEGCPVREVSYGGRTYYVGPSIPRRELVKPIADAR